MSRDRRALSLRIMVGPSALFGRPYIRRPSHQTLHGGFAPIVSTELSRLSPNQGGDRLEIDEFAYQFDHCLRNDGSSSEAAKIFGQRQSERKHHKRVPS